MDRPSSGPPLLREINTATVLAVLRDSSPLRLAEIAKRTGLSRPTVGQSVEKLVALGWAGYVDTTTGAGPGRPARSVRFRSEAGHIVGVDVGRHKILVLIADLVGQIVATVHHDLHDEVRGDRVLAEVKRLVFDALDQAQVSHQTVVSVAVGTPGTVDPATRAVTFVPSLPGWQAVPLQDEMRGWFDCPMHVENDANLAALAERWRGIAQDTETVVYVHWGARLGAGVLIGGELHRGAFGAAGEIGYLTITSGTKDALPDDHGLGPFERAVGAGAIVELARRTERTRAARSDDGGGGRVRHDRFHEAAAEELFQAALNGDAHARRAIDTTAARLAKGLAPILLVLDPELVVLGGGISKAGPDLLNTVSRHLDRLTLKQPRLELSALGTQATALGAVRLGLTDVEHRLLPNVATHKRVGSMSPDD